MLLLMVLLMGFSFGAAWQREWDPTVLYVETIKYVPSPPVVITETVIEFFDSPYPVEVIKEIIRTVNVTQEVIVTNIIYRTKPFVLGDSIYPLPPYTPYGNNLYRIRIDCDDITYYTFLYLMEQPGVVKIEIMYGNLQETNEDYAQSNHYWLMVYGESGAKYPYDMGYYIDDEQHYEGMVISLRELLRYAMVDQ